MLSFGRISLKAARPALIPAEPKTLGEHLRKRRIELGLRQQDAGKRLGVGESTVCAWERGIWPPDRYWPRIVDFLGYSPQPQPRTLGEQLVATRRARGLSRQRAAVVMGVDEGTLFRYESGERKPTTARSRYLVDRFLSLPKRGDHERN
ncbi:MAG: transcriptional regulator [Alphaproteobacteria bacterium]|nr:transcriptional regulator [Alphaproteobacteria bacterium]